jgi:phage/plasmid primase-like uncharacterized protein
MAWEGFLMHSSSKEWLELLPQKKSAERIYNEDYVLTKAKNHWPDIWDSSGIHFENTTCPLCGKEGFEITDMPNGEFRCNKCKKNGYGFQLIQFRYIYSREETIEKIGRILRLQKTEIR